jgi:hypothetical protein
MAHLTYVVIQRAEFAKRLSLESQVVAEAQSEETMEVLPTLYYFFNRLS